MDIEAHIQLDRSTFMQAYALHLRNFRPWRIWRVIIGVCAVLVLLLGLAATAVMRDLSLGGPLLIAGVVLVAGGPVMGRMRASQVFRALRPKQREARVTFSDVGVDAVGDGVQSHAAWTAFSDFQATHDVALIYQTPLLFMTVPRRAFANDADWQAFTRLAQTRIAQRP